MPELFGKDQYDLLQKNTSPRIALWFYRGLVAAGFCGVLLVVGGFVLKLNEHVVSPSIEFLTKHNPKLSVSGFGNVLVSVALTILLLVVAAYLARRWFRTWEGRFNDLGIVTIKTVESIQADVEHLKRNSADITTTKNAVQRVMSRLRRLEPAPLPVKDFAEHFAKDVAGSAPGPGFGKSPSIAGLERAASYKDALVRELKGEDDGITNVGERTWEGVEGRNEPPGE